jgi:hypothetical protein
MGAADDASIGDADRVFRRVIESLDMLAYDYDDQRWRLSSGCLKLNEDGISVYLESTLTSAGRTAQDVAATGRGDLVAAIPVAAVRGAACGVVRDPLSVDDDPIGESHALITADMDVSGKERKRRVARVAGAAELVLGEVRLEPPPL